MRTEIPIQYGIGDDELRVDVAGRPIWPVREPCDESDLARLAKLFGGRPIVISETIPRQSVAGPGAVASMSAEARPFARLYAHLSQRRTVEVGAGIEIPADVEVIVAVWSEMTPLVFEELYCRKRPVAVGIIAAPTATALRRAVLLRAAAAWLAPVRLLSCVAVFPDSNVPESGLEHRVFGHRARPSEVVRSVTSPSSVLAMAVHSDGIDASLGDVVLCATRGRQMAADGWREPTCVTSGYCHRLKTSITAAHGHERLLTPDELEARALVFGACWGAIPQPAAVAPQWTIADGLLQSATIGATLTPWREAFVESHHLQGVIDDLTNGGSVGTALRRHNDQIDSTQPGNQLCLLGDPRVQPVLERVPRFVVPEAPYTRKAEDRLCISEANFLRTILLSVRQPATHELRYAVARRVASVESPSAGRDAARWTQQLTDDVLSALLCLKDRTLAKISLRIFTGATLTEGRETCFVCGQIASIIDARIGVERFFRELVFCPVCGIIQDRPHSRPDRISVVYDGRRTVTFSRAPAKPSSAAIIVDTRLVEPRRQAIWPVGASGQLVSAFELPFELPRSLFFMTIPLLEAGALTVHRIHGRAISSAE